MEATSNISILLIEDDAVDRLAFKKLVASGVMPCTFEIAQNIAEARHWMATRTFDVIVSDYNLPDGKAFDLLENLGDQIVILTTGSGDEETAIKALRAGVSDYLVKDGDLKYLRALPNRVENALQARRIRSELRESESRLRDLFDGTSDLIQSVSRDGRILYVNRAWRETMGYSEDEVPALNMFTLIREDRRDHCRALFQRILAGEDVGLAEMVFETKDGRAVSLEGRIQVRYAGCVAVSTKSILRNVTERKEKDEQLKLLESCLARVNEIVMITEAEPLDLPGPRIVYVNDAFEKITGYSREETLGKTPRILHGPDTDHEECRRVRQSLERWETVSTTLLNYTSDGRAFWNELTIAPVADSTGWITHWVAVERDVTERKLTEAKLKDLTGNLEKLVTERTGELVESEERFRQMADAINEVFCMMDIATGSILYVSPSYERIWKRTCKSLYDQPLDWFSCIHADDRKMVANSFQSTPGAKNEIDYRIILKDGATRWIHSRVFFVRNEAGEPFRAVCIASDFTESKPMREQMLRTQRLESLGTLSGGVAHDLNNALSPILMGLDLLRHRYRDDTDMIDTMESSAKRGAAMVRQLLTFAKGVEGERALIHPEVLIREMAKIINGTFPKNIQLEISFTPNDDPVLGDATQLHQVLLNLCVNARDAMPSGGVLKLSTNSVDMDSSFASSISDARPGRYVEWRVSDTGCGIPPAVLERMFEPFFTTKDTDKGTGLGLSTALGIVKSHGGCIDVHSKLGNGATFSIFLPVAEDVSSASAAIGETPAEGFRGNGESVLVVDDELPVREMTRAVLQSINFKVATARDGTEAIINVAELRDNLSLVITDLHMPHMDGIGFIRLLRRMAPSAAVVVASGRIDDASAKELEALGIKAVLNKPFTQEKLIIAIKRALREAELNSTAR